MPPTPVIAGVHRVVLNWVAGTGQHAVNVMHFKAPALDDVQVLDAIEAAVDANQWVTVTNAAHVAEISSQKLDGLTAPTPRSPTSPALWLGDATGDFIPQGCTLLKLTTGLIGRENRGRIYLPFIGEAVNDSGVVDASNQALCQTAWDNFRLAMEVATCELGVASYKNAAWHALTGLVVEGSIATQRRRHVRS